MEFGYWGLKARGFMIELVLNAGGADYTRTTMTSPTEWGAKKSELNEKSQFKGYANLPYLIDGDRTLFESMAIMKYVARKYNFFATEEPAAVTQDIVDSVISDMYGSVYSKRFQKPEDTRGPACKAWAKDMSKLEGLDSLLSKSTFLAGEKKTYVDFMLLALGDMLVFWESDVYEKCANIKRHKATMLECEKTAAYYEKVKDMPNMPPLDMM